MNEKSLLRNSPFRFFSTDFSSLLSSFQHNRLPASDRSVIRSLPYRIALDRQFDFNGLPAKVLDKHVPGSVLLLAHRDFHTFRNFFHDPLHTGLFCQFPADFIVQSLFKVRTNGIRFSLSVHIPGHRRHAVIEIFSVCHQHFRRRWLYQLAEMTAAVCPFQMQRIFRLRNSFVPFAIV